MAAIRDRTKGSSYDHFPEDEPLSVAQQQLQQLLKKQLSTRKVSLKGTLEAGPAFTPPVLFKPLASEVEGLHSLEQYQVKKEQHTQLDHLRELGLTSDEIRLKLSCDEEHKLGPGLGPGSAKRKKLSVEPGAQQERIEALQQKIISREELLQEPLKFSGAHHMSRHAMEVEKSLFQHLGNPLTHLTVEDSQHHVLYPSRVIPSTVSSPKEPKVQAGTVSQAEEVVVPVPPQVIQRNRLGVEEIRALPRFSNYQPGKPSKVLYLKNLHPSITVEDLEAVFASAVTSRRPNIRLMTGRMRGQAFAKFSCKPVKLISGTPKGIEDAVAGMELVNGYVMREKPVIISYGLKDHES